MADAERASANKPLHTARRVLLTDLGRCVPLFFAEAGAGSFRLVPDELVVEVDEFDTADPAMRGEMISTITLADAPCGGTDVVGMHENLPPGLSAEDNETGWRMALAKLAALAEGEGERARRESERDDCQLAASK